MTAQPEKLFSFLEIGELRDGELWLELNQKTPADLIKGYLPVYKFAIRLDGVSHPIGKIEIRIGNAPNLILYGGHIGYSVEEKWRNQNVATRSCKLLFPVALKHGLDEIWITCRPENDASARVCEKIGGEYMGLTELPLDHEMRKEKGRTQSKRFKFDLKLILK